MASSAFSASLSYLIATKNNPTPQNVPERTSIPATAKGGRPRPSKTPKSSIFNTHNRNTHERAAADMLAKSTDQIHSTSSEHLDDASWHRSKRRMDEKARLYAALKRGDVEDDGERYGVDFDKKWAEKADADDDGESSSSDDDLDHVVEGSDGTDQQLVEWTDEFGRTRRGTAREAARAQRALKRSAQADEAANSDRFTARPVAPSRVIRGDTIQAAAFNPDDAVATQMADLAARRDRELTPPDAGRYDSKSEVRTKGTGFYAFSRDEAERREERDALEKERKETERLRHEKEQKEDERKNRRRLAIEARRRAIHEQKARKQADEFLDGLGADILQKQENQRTQPADGERRSTVTGDEHG